LLIAILIRMCAGGPTSDSDSTAAPPSEALPAAEAAPIPAGPTDAEKAKWHAMLIDEQASASLRLRAARDLIGHFPGSEEAVRAQAMLADLEKTVAYEAMGRQWMYNSSAEGMSGKNVVTASVQSTNTISLGFPYEGAQRGMLTLRRHPRWGNDVIFRIQEGQILCHSYGDCRVNVKFDEGQVARYEGNPPEDNSSEVVFIPAYGAFRKKIPNAKKVMIEVSIYQAGNHIFEFDVSGFKPEKFE